MALITYFDEVKYQAGTQPYRWPAGNTVNADLVRELENQVADLSEECLNKSTLGRYTKSHAAAIFNRAENFKDWPDVGKKLGVPKKLSKIIDRHDEVFKVYAPRAARMIAQTDFDRRTFMFFVERMETRLLDPHRYNEWPTEGSWLKPTPE